MWRFAWENFKGDIRSLAVLLTTLTLTLPTALLLTSATRTERLILTNSVADHWRGSYDILVRPDGTTSTLEKDSGLVAPGFLATIYGGISLEQLSHIRDIPGIDVAAPLAIIGTVSADFDITTDIGSMLPSHERAFTRTTVSSSSRNGAFRQNFTPYIDFFTPHTLELDSAQAGFREIHDPPSSLTPGNPLLCEIQKLTDITHPYCHSPFSIPDGAVDNRTTVEPTDTSAYLLLGAIDPQAEAALSHIDERIVKGRYFDTSDYEPYRLPAPESSQPSHVRLLPILLNSHMSGIDRTLDFDVDLLPAPIAEEYAHTGTGSSEESARTFTDRLLSEPPVLTQHFTSGMTDIWEAFLSQHSPLSSDSHAMQHDAAPSPEEFRTILSQGIMLDELVRPGALDVSADSSGTLHPHTYSTRLNSPSLSSLAPKYRSAISLKIPYSDPLTKTSLLSLIPVGHARFDSHYDETQLSGAFSPLAPTRVDVSEESQSILATDTYLSDGEAEGYVPLTPAILTPLDSFIDAYREIRPDLTEKPISAIRIRVADIDSMSEQSTEKIRLVAQKISEIPGLNVDILTGSSMTSRDVVLPPVPELEHTPANSSIRMKSAGLPEIHLRDLWVEKGTATTLVTAINSVSLILAILVLCSASLTLVLTTSVHMNSKVRHCTILYSLGWTRRTLTQFVLLYLSIIAASGAIAGATLAFLLAQVWHIHLSLCWIISALPLSFILTLLTIASPLIASRRNTPLDALLGRGKPRLTAKNLRARYTRSHTGSFTIAFSLLRRHPSRCVISSLCMAIGICITECAMFLFIHFHGNIVGTLLGKLISIQARTPDIVASVVLAVFALVAILTVTWISLGEDAQSYATLVAGGWTRRRIFTVILTQSLILGLIGAIAGASLAVGTLRLIGVPFSSLLTQGGEVAALVFALPVVALALVTAGTLILARVRSQGNFLSALFR